MAAKLIPSSRAILIFSLRASRRLSALFLRAAVTVSGFGYVIEQGHISLFGPPAGKRVSPFEAQVSAEVSIYIDRLCGCEAWRDPAGDHAAQVCRGERPARPSAVPHLDDGTNPAPCGMGAQARSFVSKGADRAGSAPRDWRSTARPRPFTR
jgi:hypothetical protein